MLGQHRIDAGAFVGVERDPRRGGVFVEAGDAAGAGDRHDVLAPMQQPRQRELRRRAAARLRKGGDGVDQRAVCAIDCAVRRVRNALALLRERYAETLPIVALAEAGHMRPSALYAHFRDVTGMSPLQFQKRLRLQEARRLMLGEGLDAAEAGHRVGYESASHFSREYRRLFGAPPRREVATAHVVDRLIAREPASPNER